MGENYLKKMQTLSKKLSMMSLIGYQAMTMLKRKTSMKRKQNWKKLLTQSYKNSTKQTVEVWEVTMMTGMMMMTLQTTTNFKLELRELNEEFREQEYLESQRFWTPLLLME